MAPDDTNDDEQLLAELRASYARTDPVPAAVLAAGRAAIELRDLDAQLAELLRDSAIEDKELAGVRGLGQRLLTFARGERYVEVDVATSGDVRELSGYVVPLESGTLAVEHSHGVDEVSLDERGRFRLANVMPGPVRLRVIVPGRPVLITPWVPV